LEPHVATLPLCAESGRTFDTLARAATTSRPATFVAIGAPKNTPTEIIGRLNHEINAGLADPKIKSRLADVLCVLLFFIKRLK
jgi:hypothetical protein